MKQFHSVTQWTKAGCMDQKSFQLRHFGRHNPISRVIYMLKLYCELMGFRLSEPGARNVRSGLPLSWQKFSEIFRSDTQAKYASISLFPAFLLDSVLFSSVVSSHAFYGQACSNTSIKVQSAWIPFEKDVQDIHLGLQFEMEQCLNAFKRQL